MYLLERLRSCRTKRTLKLAADLSPIVNLTVVGTHGAVILPRSNGGLTTFLGVLYFQDRQRYCIEYRCCGEISRWGYGATGEFPAFSQDDAFAAAIHLHLMKEQMKVAVTATSDATVVTPVGSALQGCGTLPGRNFGNFRDSRNRNFRLMDSDTWDIGVYQNLQPHCEALDKYATEAACLFWDRGVNAWSNMYGTDITLGTVDGVMNVPVQVPSESETEVGGATKMLRQATVGATNIWKTIMAAVVALHEDRTLDEDSVPRRLGQLLISHKLLTHVWLSRVKCGVLVGLV